MLLRSSTNVRRGISLLEAILAASMLFITVAALHQMLTSAGRRARDVRDNGFAVQLCQSKMNEVAAGAVALSSSPYAQVEENQSYQWAMTAEQAEVSGLWQVEIRVRLTRADGVETEEAADDSLVVLRQFVLDPARRGSTMDTANIAGSSTEPPSTEEPATSPTTPATGGTTTTPAGGTTTTPMGGSTTRPGGR